MKYLVGLGLLVVASCTAGPEKFTTPDGQQAVLVNCSGKFTSMTACYAQAREICKGDYVSLKENEYTRGFKSIREMQFTCKN